MSTTSSLDGEYSPSVLDDLQYGDSTSSIYPNRPIHPLPKRRLRSRLSPEVADSILFPQGIAPSIHSRQIANDDGTLHSRENGDQSGHSSSQQRPGQVKDSYQFRGSPLDDEAINGIHRRTIPNGFSSGRNAYLATTQDDPRLYRHSHMPPPIPPSVTSSGDSVDGYDSFENTNNKKKRKIPISGSLTNHQSSLSADMAHMDIASSRNTDASPIDPDEGPTQYYGTASSTIIASSYASGVSSLGKGKPAKSGLRRPSGRSPLGVSFNGSNASHANRSTLNNFNKEEASNPERLTKSNSSTKEPANHGIISAAIANAAAMPSSSPRHREEVSLLEQRLPKKSSSSKNQFTFVCESDSAKSMAWPGFGYPSSGGSVHGGRSALRGGGPGPSQPTFGVSTQGTQTSPSIADHLDQTTQPGPDQQTAQPPRKPRRPLAKQLALAAQKRKMRQDRENNKNPPKQEKVWVCDFCEYETIFGKPPRALIQQYEIKDRRERRRLAEKQRLLEKAKMKNRKGKKGNKNKNQNQASAQSQQQIQKNQRDLPDNNQGALQSQDTLSDEQDLEDYDEDSYDPQASEQAQSPPPKNSQPMVQAKNHLVRPPAQ